MELYPHNRRAYESLAAMLEERQRACIIQPTGTGKFVIGAHFAMEHPDSRILWLCPSDYIFAQQRANLRRIAPGRTLGNVEQMTYATAMSRARSGALKARADYIVLDEFHHIGAPEWSRGVAKILELNPEARIIGMSATAVRYGDGARNMADEFFRGNVASELSLEEALLAGVIPMPKYVTALYDAPSELGEMLGRIDGIDDGPMRGKLLKRYEGLRRALDLAGNVDEVFRRHIDRPDAKIVVFCRNAEHLEQMAALSSKWFGGVNPDIHVYRTYCGHSSSMADFDAFRWDSSGALKVIYCINRLSEGVHIDGVDGVVMVRPTASPVVFAQQLGRALEVGGGRTPLVFDLVNNLGSAGSALGFSKALEASYAEMRERGENPPLVPRDFVIHDEIRDNRGLAGLIRDAIDAVELEEKVEWVLSHLSAEPETPEGRRRLKRYSGELRRLHRAGRLDDGQAARLLDAGFVLSSMRGRAVTCFETGEVFESADSAAASVSVTADALRAAIRGRYAAGGLHWHYADDPKPDPDELRPARKSAASEETRERIVEAIGKGDRTYQLIGEELGVSAKYVARVAQTYGVRSARNVTEEERARIRELLGQGLTNEEIMEITGRSLSLIYEEVGEHKGHRRRHLDEEKSALCREMLEEGSMTHGEIAERLGVPLSTVRGFSERHRLGRGLRAAKAVACVDTGDVFPSLAAAARSVGAARPDRLRDSIDKGAPYKGLRWRYATAEEAQSI